jgi:DNA-3-methyladenine glycosylase I
VSENATKKTLRRCAWCGDDELYVAYHDTEWGVPTHGDAALFELLTLEGAQAGLSWLTVLRRREGYRRAFAGFDPTVVISFDESRVDQILADPGVIRNRLKVASTVANAGAILDLDPTLGGFDEFVWSLGRRKGDSATVAREMSKSLKSAGFRFVGPTVCLSFMQSSGMVNEHARDCFRFKEINALAKQRRD